MASSIFDTLTGVSIDSPTGLTVQSLLDQNSSNLGLSADSPIVAASQTPITLDEEDVFQCGKCKKQFISLHMFLSHKKEGPCDVQSLIYRNGMDVMDDAAISAANVSEDQSPTAEAFDVTQLGVGQPIILGETDLLSFSIEQTSLQLTSTSQILPSFPVEMQGSFLENLKTESNFADDKSSPTPNESGNACNGLNMNLGCQSIFLATQLQTEIPSPVGGFVVATASGSLYSESQVQASLPDAGIGPALPEIESIPTSNTISIREGSVKETDLLSSSLQALTDEGGGPQCEGVNKLVQEGSTEVISLEFLKLVPPPKPKLREPTKKKHKCNYCGKAFAKNFDIQQHMRSHTGERPFQCVVCGRAFSQKSNVKKHMLTHRVWPSGLTNTLPSDPIQVISLENSIDDGQEMDPEKGITKDENVQVVIDSSYVCQYCSRAFRSYLELKSHMKDHSNQKMFKCIQRKCGQTFADLDEFLVHTKNHSSEEVRYRCHVCCEIFTSLAELGTHQYTHVPSSNSNSSSSIENECDLSNGETAKTVASAPKTPTRQYRCEKCRSYFATPEALDHHNEVATHYHPCPHCKRIFHCERYLRRHLLTHETARIIAAPDDPEVFSPTLLVGSFECDICSKKFRTERYMTSHRLIHFENRPHSCSQCPASFNRRDKLVRHQLIHEPVKRYKCPFRHTLDCKKEFNRQDKLKLHVLTHNSTKRFHCTKCSLTFQKQNLIDEHVKKCIGRGPVNSKSEIQSEERPGRDSSVKLVSEERKGEEAKKKEKRSSRSQAKTKRKRVLDAPGNSKRKNISAEAKKPTEPKQSKGVNNSKTNQATTVVSTVVGEDGVPTIEIIVMPVATPTGYGIIGPYRIDVSGNTERVEENLPD